jgi:hypothetical protein
MNSDEWSCAHSLVCDMAIWGTLLRHGNVGIYLLYTIGHNFRNSFWILFRLKTNFRLSVEILRWICSWNGWVCVFPRRDSGEKMLCNSLCSLGLNLLLNSVSEFKMYWKINTWMCFGLVWSIVVHNYFSNDDDQNNLTFESSFMAYNSHSYIQSLGSNMSCRKI